MSFEGPVYFVKGYCSSSLLEGGRMYQWQVFSVGTSAGRLEGVASLSHYYLAIIRCATIIPRPKRRRALY